jgi:hypothetical protein
MSAETPDPDALIHAARDIARHIASMAEELSHLRHNSGGESQTLIERQVMKLGDQVTLLAAVVRDIEQATHAAPAS